MEKQNRTVHAHQAHAQTLLFHPHRAHTLIATLPTAAETAHATPDRRPNIIFVVADDMGNRDTGYSGNPVVKTPHLDAIAARIFFLLEAPERAIGLDRRAGKWGVLKSTPVLRFKHDDSAIRGVEIVNLLEEVDKLSKAPLEDEEI